MASSQEPHEYADAPQGVLELAKASPGLTLNLRPDHWSAEEIECFRGDRPRQIRAALYYGTFMSRPLTDFLNKLEAGDMVAICAQEAAGKIVLVVGTVREIYWIDGKGPGGLKSKKNARYSVHAAIRLEEDRDYTLTKAGQVWGNYVLAIAQVSKNAHPLATPDPEGRHFVEAAQKFGIYK